MRAGLFMVKARGILICWMNKLLSHQKKKRIIIKGTHFNQRAASSKLNFLVVRYAYKNVRAILTTELVILSFGKMD